MIADVEHRQGSLCQIHGHAWQETGQKGKLQCIICQTLAYCPSCLHIVPVGVLTIRCDRHKEKDNTMGIQQQPDRHSYRRPQPPDMLDNGLPQLTTLRTSRARQINYLPTVTEEVDTEPALLRRHDRLVKRAIRTILARWLLLGFGVFLIVGMYAGYQAWVLPSWIGLQDQWHTGDGRITQLDANVGHHGESHFLAQYYQGAILVVEIPLSDPGHIQTYSLPALSIAADGKTLTLTLSIADMNHDGKPDLVIQMEGTSMILVLYNTGTAFARSEV